MTVLEDILIRIKGQDETGKAFDTVTQRSSKLRAVVGVAMTGAGLAMSSFAKEAVQSSVEAEKGWLAFSNAYNQAGGDFDNNSKKIKSSVSSIANTMGRSVGDVRKAYTDLLLKTGDVSQATLGLKAINGIAAATGQDYATAENVVIGALNGRAMALKRLGLDIKDYRDEQTKTIDSHRLMQDILAKTGDAQEDYADSTTAMQQRVTNSMNRIKTDIGGELTKVLDVVLPVIQGIVTGFANLPQPLKSVIAVFLGFGAVAMIIAGPLTSLISLFTMITGSGILPALVSGFGTLSSLLSTIGGLFLSAASSVWAFLGPLGPIIVAIIAITGAIYGLGRYMGWWTSWGEMVEAFKGKIIEAWSWISRLGQMAWNAGVAILNGLGSSLSGIGDMVWREFSSIADKITGATDGAVEAAKQFGQSIWQAAMNALGIHSPGIIQNMIAWEFGELPNRILESRDSAARAASEYGSSVVQGFNMQELQQQPLTQPLPSSSTVNKSNVTNVYVNSGAVQCDLSNLTTKESQLVMTKALEGLYTIKEVQYGY